MTRAPAPSGRRLALVAVVTVVALAGSCAWFDDRDEPMAEADRDAEDMCAAENTGDDDTVPPFYVPDCPLTGASHPGKVVRSEPVDGAPSGTRSWRILHRSTTADDQPTVVSALVVVPDRPPPPGGWPPLVVAHGTTGIARPCAPSIDPASGNGDVGEPTTFEQVAPFVAAGYAVVAPDYRGLGSPGPHPYLIADETGRNVLDAVRALRELPEVVVADQVLMWGVSQGGHAVAAAAAMAERYADDVSILGVVEAAPAAELSAMLGGLQATGNRLALSYVMTVVAAWSVYFEDADPDAVLHDDAVDALDGAFEHCLVGALAALGPTAEPSSFRADLTAASPWSELLVDNTPGAPSGGVPVLVVQGTRDVVVQPAVTESYVQGLCGAGAQVELRSFGGATHESIATRSLPLVLDWFAARRASQPVTSSCR